MPNPAGTCLVMLSGGVDSAVLLYEQLASGEKPVAMTRATKAREVEAAKQIADLAGVPHIILNPREEAQRLFDSAIFERMDPRDHLGPGAFPHICSLADSLAFAALFSIPKVLWGWRRSEMHPLEQPDIFPDYLAYISLHSSLRQCPTIEAPFFEWTKNMVLETGSKLGVPLHYTFSCIKDQSEPCGDCRRCVEREAAFREAGY